MQKNNHSSSDKGSSGEPVRPKENSPENHPAESKPKEEKAIDIGMPISKEEMERLKEEAKKMDR